MKKQMLSLIGRNAAFRIMLLSLLSFAIVSCEKESFVEPVSDDTVESSILSVLKGAPSKGSESIAEIAIGAGFGELVSALSYVDDELNAGLVDLFLNGKDQYTVFAPTDDAFMSLYDALGIEMISDLPAELVLDVLLYHVTDGRRASNSVVPPVKMRGIETLLGAYIMVDSKGMITAKGNTSSIITADISASNGIIHVIDAVLLPIGGSEESEETAKKGAPKKGMESIAGIAINAGFSELVGALMYVDSELNAGLVDLFLNGTDQYTVFAPTNEAFEGLYSALDIDAITDLPADLVLNVLLYHVTEGRRGANSVVPAKKMRSIETLLGVKFLVDTNGMIHAVGNSAGIVAADISASNGIIHVIDAVILPIE